MVVRVYGWQPIPHHIDAVPIPPCGPDHNPSALGSICLPPPPPPLCHFILFWASFRAIIAFTVPFALARLLFTHHFPHHRQPAAPPQPTIVIIVIVIAVRRTHLLGMNSAALTSWLDVIFSVHPPPAFHSFGVTFAYISFTCLSSYLPFSFSCLSRWTKQFNQPTRDTQIGPCGGFRDGFLSIAFFYQFPQ